MVSLVEEHETRVEYRYSLDDWYLLSGMERAFCVAQRRIGIAMKNLQAEAEIESQKHIANKGKADGKDRR